MNYGSLPANTENQVKTLFACFAWFSCDLLPSLFFVNIANVLVVLIILPLVYGKERDFNLVATFIVGTIVLNIACIVISMIMQKFKDLMVTIETLLKVHKELLSNMKEGFITLSEDGQNIFYANLTAKQIVTQFNPEEDEDIELREIVPSDFEQDIFVKIKPKLLKKPEHDGEMTFRQRIESYDDGISLASLIAGIDDLRSEMSDCDSISDFE